jgi:selenocysteine-specific elongation factor
MDVVKKGVKILRDEFKRKGEITMSEFRILVDTSRKYSLPLLNYYDSQGYTLRRGDVRVPGALLYPKDE